MKCLPGPQNFRICISPLSHCRNHYPLNRMMPAIDTDYYRLVIDLFLNYLPCDPQQLCFHSDQESRSVRIPPSNGNAEFLILLSLLVVVQFIYLVASMPLPGVFWNKWSEICVSYVGNGSCKSQQPSCYLIHRRVLVSMYGLEDQLHRTGPDRVKRSKS